MKRILLAGAFVLAVAGHALAADLPQPGPPPPRAPAAYAPLAPIYNWGGIYFGVNAGYGFGVSNWTLPGGSVGAFNTDGFLVGGTVGANFQAGALVFGLEGDLDWDNISGNSAFGCGGFAPSPSFTCQTAQNWLGTARGRIGYAYDRILLYATGGGAFGNIKATVNGSGLGTQSSNEFGWTAGLGVETAFAPNWTAKLEYLYVDLANGACAAACGIPAGGSNVAVSFSESLVRAGVNYKFNF